MPDQIKSSVFITPILCLISSVSRFVMDSHLPSLPAISQALDISGPSAQRTLTFYLLGFSFSQLVYGPLSDCYGRKKILISGLLIFLLGNTVCVFTSSPSVLQLGRLVAGSGAGACGVLNRAIASDCFSGAEFARIWSYTTTTLVITLIIAPLIGGYIQAFLGWRANFMLGTFYVGIVFVVILVALPETNFHRAHSCEFRHTLKIYFSILSCRSFIIATLCYTLAFAGLIAYFQASPFLLITVLGLSPVQYGWSTLIIAASYLVGGLLVKNWVHKIGTQNMLQLGIVILIVGGLSMLICFYLLGINLITILVPTTIYVIGARIVIPNAIAEAMVKFRTLGGSTSALIGGIQMLGSALISLLVASFSYETVLPLSLLLTGLGVISLVIFKSVKF